MKAASLSKSHVAWACAGLSVALAALSLLVPANAQTGPAKAVGTVRTARGDSLILANDGGGETTVNFAGSVRVLQATPGQTDLNRATPIRSADIQVGDRIAVRGTPGEGNALIASTIIVMKQGDIAERQRREREEWRRGVGGIVKQVDAAAGTVTILNALVAAGKPIIVHVSPQAAIRRYSSDSIRFDDARPSTLDQIRPGDQLRARGARNADGQEFTAQAIVSGTFRDIAGTVLRTDAANNLITVTDLRSKKPVLVKVNGESQLRRLPPVLAAGIAIRLKGGTPEANGTPEAKVSSSDVGPPGGQRGAGNWRAGASPPDFQQMLARMPPVSISDLKTGDAVMLVATEGSPASGPTAITLLAGVEPILSAAPAGTSASTILSPWNLGEPAAAGGDAPAQ